MRSEFATGSDFATGKGRTMDFDAIIIGAGVIGTSVALGLSRAGCRTLNVDALPAAGYGSTSNSSAVIRPFYSAMETCALAHEARHQWTRWADFLDAADESGFAEYVECGILVLMGEGDKERFAPSVLAMREVGVPFEYLSPDDIRQRMPAITLQSFGPPKLPGDLAFGMANETPLSGGLFIPEAGYVGDPQLAAHNLQRAAEALGAVFRFNLPVTAINQPDGRAGGILTASGESVSAPIVVNVAGPHSSQVNALAGVTADIAMATRPMRHEVAHIPAPENFDPQHGGCVIADGDAGVYFRPEGEGHMLIGSLDPECDGKDYVDADEYNQGFTEQWTRQVWRTAQRFPGLGIPNTAQGVVGLYDATDDWVPVYDKSSLPGFYMAIGTSGNQFKNAPVIGALMAELILACESGHDHDNDPVRFDLPHLGRSIDLGFFSRKRDSHTEGSGTVLA